MCAITQEIQKPTYTFEHIHTPINVYFNGNMVDKPFHLGGILVPHKAICPLKVLKVQNYTQNTF